MSEMPFQTRFDPKPVQRILMSPTDDVLVCLNGKLFLVNEAKISLLDSSYQRGVGVFETMLGVGEKIPLLNLHLTRLASSCESLGIRTPDFDMIGLALPRLLQEQSLGFSRIRLTVSHAGGEQVPERTEWFAADGESSWSIVVLPTMEPMIDHTQRLRVTTSPYPVHSRTISQGHKTTSYFNSVLNRRYAASNGFDEAVICNEKNFWTECSAANLFVQRQDVIVTPPLESGCLPGIMRQLVIEALSHIGVSCREENISTSDLEQINFAFLSSAVRGIVGISQINNKTDLSSPEWWEKLTARIRNSFAY